jgi:pimeloyl-ACP methyl ester carboxylesterase
MRIERSILGVGLALALWFAGGPAFAEPPTFGPELQGFVYPWPVRDYAFASQGEAMTMRYMDVAPTMAPNGATAVLLHGKNFCAATWEATIRALSEQGYRVIAPDQIGFCKSSKPARYQYSFQALAENTHALLESLGVGKIILIGHSTGGMLAARYALITRTTSPGSFLSTRSGSRTGRRLAFPRSRSTSGSSVSGRRRRNVSAPTSSRLTTPANGAAPTIAGSRCSRASPKDRAATSSRATPG